MAQEGHITGIQTDRDWYFHRAALADLNPPPPPEPEPALATNAPLTTAQVARLFNVRSRTVINWTRSGALPFFRTPSGHLRFPRAAITALLNSTEDSPRG